jgi:protein disulfide-isomerase A6
MKPAWDKLGTEFADSSSVLIGDADCTVETELCSDHGVKGYPTIKYFPAGEGKAGAKDYGGGRDFDSLKKFTEETLAGGCDVDDESTCDEKENAYNAKMRAKGADAIAKQLKRLEGMKNKPMKPELKKWMMARLNILTQLDGKSEL